MNDETTDTDSQLREQLAQDAGVVDERRAKAEASVDELMADFEANKAAREEGLPRADGQELDLSDHGAADTEARMAEYETAFQDATKAVRAERVAESAERDLGKAVSFVKERAGFPDGVTDDHVRQLLMTEAENNPALVSTFEKRNADPRMLEIALGRVADKFRAEIVDPLLRVDQSVTADKEAVRQAMRGYPPPRERGDGRMTIEEVRAIPDDEWEKLQRKAGIQPVPRQVHW